MDREKAKQEADEITARLDRNGAIEIMAGLLRMTMAEFVDRHMNELRDMSKDDADRLLARCKRAYDAFHDIPPEDANQSHEASMGEMNMMCAVILSMSASALRDHLAKHVDGAKEVFEQADEFAKKGKFPIGMKTPPRKKYRSTMAWDQIERPGKDR